jgi:DNA polymerase III delta prime subunit
MEMSFIQKYKPKTLIDFNLDENLLQLLNTFILIDSINILLVANSGIGKTSIIESIIKEYYGNNYDISNVLYINSLKEQGISFYRSDVKTFCQTKSTMLNKKKFVILDDMDIINDQSQQVFRNYIDKYNNNVHFIASCTNTQKIIDSIQSRLNIIKINYFKPNHFKNILNNIKLIENINMDEEAENFILSISNNSIRTLINYMEKIKLIDRFINKQTAINLCTNINFIDFEIYTQMCMQNNITSAIKILYDIFDNGYSVMDIFDNYFLFIKGDYIINELKKYEIIKLLCKYISIFHNIHEDEIELALFTNNLIQILICNSID